MAKRRTKEHHDGELYFEEVEAYVDATVEAIVARDIGSRAEALLAIEDAVQDSNYCCEPTLCVVVLTHSKFPTAYFAAFDWDNEDVDEDGTTPFPFDKFAVESMVWDARERLSKREEFRALPLTK